MTRKLHVVLAMLLSVCAAALGESRRTMFTYENMLPEKGQFEVGLLGWYREVPDEKNLLATRDEYRTEPYVRYGLTEKANLTVKLPYMYTERSDETSDHGLGDIEVGAELRAFEDILGHPYIIPHVSVLLPTGDEEKGFGLADEQFIAGISLGSRMYEFLHLIADVSYVINREEENEARFSGSVVWNVDSKLSLLAEMQVRTREVAGKEDNPIYYIGGISYRFSDHLRLTLYGGSSQSAETDVLAGGRLSYSF